MPITTFFFSFAAIFRISKVHLGTEKSIMTSTFFNEFNEFNSGLIPDIFLAISIFSVRVVNLKLLSFLEDLMSCLPILPMHPVIPNLILFILKML